MSPDWAGWQMLQAGLVAATVMVGLFLVGLGLRAVYWWWQDRRARSRVWRQLQARRWVDREWSDE